MSMRFLLVLDNVPCDEEQDDFFERAIRTAATKFANGSRSGGVRDINGNQVGTWVVKGSAE